MKDVTDLPIEGDITEHEPPIGEGVMDRRQFLLAVPCGALLPSLASAQEPGRVYRMAVISPSELAAEQVRTLQLPELARLGFVVGRNLTMTTHVGPPARMPELAREAIATKPDVVVAVSTVAILAVKEASSTMPIVMSFIGEDPIAKGLASGWLTSWVIEAVSCPIVATRLTRA